MTSFSSSGNGKEKNMKIRHDIHAHTFFSSCSTQDPNASMADFVRKAAELGHSVLGISNHMWDESVPGAAVWYKGQNVDYVLEERWAISEDTLGVKILFGAECEYYGMSQTLGITAETSKKFDYILVPHTHTHMKDRVMAEDKDTVAARLMIADRIKEIAPELSSALIKRMTACISRVDAYTFHEPTEDHCKYVADFMHSSFDTLLAHPEFIKLAQTTPTIVAHPFAPCGYAGEERDRIYAFLDKDRLFEQFTKAAHMNVAMDINVAVYKKDTEGFSDDPLVEVMRIALAAGCKFSFGTDAHGVESLESIRRGDLISDAIGITEKDLIDIVK